MNALEKLLEDKKMSVYQLSIEYGKEQSPELSPADLSKKYGSLIRKTVKDPNHTKHKTVKRLIEILGGEIVVRVKRTEDLPL